MKVKPHLSCGVDWAGCDRSALQSGGMDGGTAAGRRASGTGGIDCPESAGSSPEDREREKQRKKQMVWLLKLSGDHTTATKFAALVTHFQGGVCPRVG